MRVHYLAAALGLFASGIHGSPVDPTSIDTTSVELGIDAAVANTTAIPKEEKCVESNRCDWGHVCVDGVCTKGCFSKKDCWHEQWCHKKKKQCMFTYVFPPGKECRLNGNSCGWGKSCCSGHCKANFCRRKLDIPKTEMLETAEEDLKEDME